MSGDRDEGVRFVYNISSMEETLAPLDIVFSFVKSILSRYLVHQVVNDSVLVGVNQE